MNHGAVVDVADKDGFTPLLQAVGNGYTQIAVVCLKFVARFASS